MTPPGSYLLPDDCPACGKVRWTARNSAQGRPCGSCRAKARPRDNGGYTPAPKPQKPVRGTKEAKAHMGLVAQLGCVICGRQPVIVHHCICGRFSGTRASDFDTIPLCTMHHDETSPEGIHKSKAKWEALNGPDHGYLPLVRRLIEAMKGAAR